MWGVVGVVGEGGELKATPPKKQHKHTKTPPPNREHHPPRGGRGARAPGRPPPGLRIAVSQLRMNVR